MISSVNNDYLHMKLKSQTTVVAIVMSVVWVSLGEVIVVIIVVVAVVVKVNVKFNF